MGSGIPARKERMIRIDAPHFVAGVLIEDGKVTKAAPILAWMIGKPEGYVEFYCRRKGWLLDKNWEGTDA